MPQFKWSSNGVDWVPSDADFSRLQVSGNLRDWRDAGRVTNGVASARTLSFAPPDGPQFYRLLME